MSRILSRVFEVVLDLAVAAVATYFAVYALRSGNDAAFAVVAPAAVWALARYARDERPQPKRCQSCAQTINLQHGQIVDIAARDIARRLVWGARRDL